MSYLIRPKVRVRKQHTLVRFWGGVSSYTDRQASVNYSNDMSWLGYPRICHSADSLHERRRLGGAYSARTLRMVRRFLSIGVLLAACIAPAAAADHAPGGKLDRELRQRALAPRGHSRVIVRLQPGVTGDVLQAILKGVRGTAGRRLASIGAQVADVPDSTLEALARQPGVSGVSLDRRIHGTLERTGATIDR